MTPRAVLLGLAGAAVVCAITYYNDAVMRQTYLVGNNMPVAVYGGLILFLLVVNPLLAALGKEWRFTGGELAVVLALTLAACCIPGSGLMRTFTSSLVLPHQFARTDPGWKEERIVEMIPPAMLADVSRDEDTVLNGFIQGRGVGTRHISLGDIPWDAWTRTLSLWLPLILVLWLGLVGLAVVVHRQWSEHEQLSYPIAAFADSLLPQEGGVTGSVFRNRLFWLGLGGVFAIHLLNYAVQWFPSLIPLPLSFDFTSLNEIMPTFRRSGWSWLLLRPTLYPTVVAFAFFLATDVSLSLAVGPFLYSLFVGIMAGYGVSVSSGSYLSPNIQKLFSFGAYMGVVLTIAYTGRHYYLSVFRRALFMKPREEVEPASVWGARAFLASVVVFTGSLMALGLDWPLAVPYTLGTVMVFLVMSRILAETGLFFIQPYWCPALVLVGMLGPAAVGPQAMLIMYMLSTVLLIDPRESLMPFVVNSLRLVDKWKVSTGKVALLSAAALVIGLAVAVPVTLYFQYDRGANMADGWANAAVPKFGIDESLRVKRLLEQQGTLEKAAALSGWSRLLACRPDPGLVASFVAGLAAVLLFTAGRLRFPGWPLHPVLFLVWGTYPAQMFAGSFLVGWFVKVMVMKYGGEAAYRRLRPLMMGLVAGDMLGGITPNIIGAIYYFTTGNPPKPFGILPG